MLPGVPAAPGGSSSPMCFSGLQVKLYVWGVCLDVCVSGRQALGDLSPHLDSTQSTQCQVSHSVFIYVYVRLDDQGVG